MGETGGPLENSGVDWGKAKGGELYHGDQTLTGCPGTHPTVLWESVLAQERADNHVKRNHTGPLKSIAPLAKERFSSKSGPPLSQPVISAPKYKASFE